MQGPNTAEISTRKTDMSKFTTKEEFRQAQLSSQSDFEPLDIRMNEWDVTFKGQNLNSTK